MDIFDMFFGGGGGRRQRGPSKGKDVIHQMAVSLEELYNGCTRKLAVKKKVICKKCDGRGGKEGAVEKCTTCRGTGMQIQVHQLGPGMVQQIQSVCSKCHGNGEMINPKLRCKTCQGDKVIVDRKILEVHVDKGMKDGENVRFMGEGDQVPGLEPGDIIIVLDEKGHTFYRRHANDLIMEMELQLVEALCGFQKTIKTLDDRVLIVQALPGEIIKHGDIKCVMGEGMPFHRDPFTKGRLVIKFSVKFPENNFALGNKLKELEKVLPKREEPIIPDEADVHELVEFDPNEERRRRAEAYEEDEDGMGGQRMQCQSH